MQYFKIFEDTFDVKSVIGLPSSDFLKEKVNISE